MYMKDIKTLFSPIVTLKYYSFKAYFAFTTFLVQNTLV